jgi:hypothetical protein
MLHCESEDSGKTPSSPGTAVLTINGNSFSFGTSPAISPSMSSVTKYIPLYPNTLDTCFPEPVLYFPSRQCCGVSLPGVTDIASRSLIRA